MARCDFVRGALALIIALLVMHPAAPAAAQAVSCTMTAAQIAAVAALPDPITRNAKGAYVRRGKAMDSDEVLDMCLTRRFYDLIVAREAAGGKIKFSEMGMSQPYYLTERECSRMYDLVGRLLSRSEKQLAELQDECKRMAGRGL